MTTPDTTFQRVKAIALAAIDFDRAIRFYGEVLALPPAFLNGEQVGNWLDDTVLMFKATDWYAKPSDALNPRITLETADARATAAALREKGVTIADPVEAYGTSLIGSFLDSEGNKLWFCSGPGPTGAGSR